MAAWHPVPRGYTSAFRRRAELDVPLDGAHTVFVKAAVDGRTALWLRREQLVYDHVRAPFVASRLAWDDDGDRPLLVLEDLGTDGWPPPWTPEQVTAACRAVAELREIAAPTGIKPATWLREQFGGWAEILGAPDQFLRTRIASAAWLVRWGPDLAAAESAAELDGDRLIHLDLRGDNIWASRNRAVLVDWNWALRGNPDLDLAGWLPALAAEGGPAPWELSSGLGALAALVAARFGDRAGAPPSPGSRPGLRDMQRALGAVALAWACRELGLPPPDGPAAAGRQG